MDVCPAVRRSSPRAEDETRPARGETRDIPARALSPAGPSAVWAVAHVHVDWRWSKLKLFRAGGPGGGAGREPRRDFYLYVDTELYDIDGFL